MPRCPPPLADELLSSWLKRLARANYCTEDELCRYLGLRSGRAPETLADLAGVDVAGLCSILRLVRDDLVAMLIVEHHNFPIRCVAQEDFQHCPHCITQTPGATLRHWRYAWSVTCENCGSELTPSKTGNGQVKLIPTKLKVRAARGAEFLKSTFANRSARDARRVNFAVQIAGSLNPNVSTATLTSYCQMQRFNLLAAIGMSASQPVLKAAFVLRNDAPTIENLRRAFPYQRRLLKIVIKLSDDLNRKIPRREKSEHLIYNGKAARRRDNIFGFKALSYCSSSGDRRTWPERTTPQVIVLRCDYFGKAIERRNLPASFARGSLWISRN